MGRSRNRFRLFISTSLAALLSASLASVSVPSPAFALAPGDSDVFVGIEPYGSDNQVRAFSLPAGEEVELQAFVATIGPEPATGVQVEVDVPAGVTLVSATPSVGTYDPVTSIWTVGSLNPFDFSVALVLRVARTAPGEHELVLRAIGLEQPDSHPSDNSFTAILHEPVTRWVAPGAPAGGECLTVATACDLRYAAHFAADGPVLEGDTVRVLPGDYPLSTGLSMLGGVSLVGDDPMDKPRLINTGTQTLVIAGGRGELIADLLLEDSTTVENNAGLGVVGQMGATIERVIIHSSRRALTPGANTVVRDSILIGNHSTLGTVRITSQPNVRLENVTAINTDAGPAIEGNVNLHATIARSAGAVDLKNVGTATRSNFGTSVNGVAPGSGDNQTAAPAFVDAANGDYHQAADSPTIDAGDDNVASDRRDVDFGPRKIGAAVDIGGDERGAAVRLTPAAHDFGEQAVGTGSAPATFTVKNLGTEDLTLSDAALAGTDPGQFTISRNTCNGPVAVQATCEVDVRFAPSSAGAKSASLQVTTDGGNASASVAGTATAAPAITVSPESLALGDQVVGTSSPARTLTVSNAGTAPLVIGTVTKTGTDAAQFAVSRNTCTSPVAPTASCEIDVRFSPTSLGDKSASLSIASNATAQPTLVPLSGRGTPEVRPTTLVAAPPSMNILGLRVNLTAVATLTDTATRKPLPGRTISFTVLGQPLCTAVTDSRGIARCRGLTSLIQVVLAGGYEAHFAGQNLGTVVYAPSSVQGRLIGDGDRS